MYNMKKSLLALVMAVLVMTTSLLPAFAEDLPYDTYNYDYWEDIFRTPAAYVPQGTLLGTDLTWNGESLGAFVEPQDMFVAPNGDIYLADTNNHRIVVLDNDLKTVLNVITGFDNAGLPDQFNKPTGVAVTEEGKVYIADSMNRRIVVLDAEGKLERIVEIPAAAASQAIGTTTYAVGTHIEGMSALGKSVTAADGTTWAIANLPEGSASSVTDADGLTYTVVAECSYLEAFQTKVTVDGTDYEVLTSGAGVLRMPEGYVMPEATPVATATPAPEVAEGEAAPTATPKASATPMPENVTAFTSYDPVPNKDIFILIGNLVKTIKGTPASRSSLTGIKSVWVDEDGSIYAVSDKSATKLDKNGKLLRAFASYKDASGVQTTFTNITEFAVQNDQLYIRDGENKIVVLDQEGDLVELIASNAIRVTDAEGNEVAMIQPTLGLDDCRITGLDVAGDYLLVGATTGMVHVLDKGGEAVLTVENDTVLALNAEGEITQQLTTVKNGKVTERFTGLTGVAMLEDKLCVAGADNRVIVLNADGTAAHIAQNNCVNVVTGGEVTNVITGYEFGGESVTFAAVGGVEGVALNYVCDGTKRANQRVQRQVCICDSADNLIVLDGSLNVTRVTKDADSEVLEDGYVFTPMKVAVDYAGRIYCIAQNMFEGIMVFETNGEFTGFFGTIQVTISAWDKFWRKLATKEERSKQQLFIPTEFTGIDIDQEGFVYASNVDTAGTQAVRRLNPKGEDVIRQGANANLGGDLWVNGTSQYAGASKIVDVVYRDKGVYSLLDSKRGRVFTYDHEGNLLYIFGGLGTQEGTLNKPVAIEYADDRLLVLDATQCSILIYGETEYGRLINDAVALRYDGDEAQAVTLWEQVLRLDENNELANTGIGKAYLSAGDNEKAMEYLKRGMNREYYSIAFKRYRNELLKDNIQYVLTGAVVLVAALMVYFKAIKPKLDAKNGRRV